MASPRLSSLVLDGESGLYAADITVLTNTFPRLVTLSLHRPRWSMEASNALLLYGHFPDPYHTLTSFSAYVKNCSQAESWNLSRLTRLVFYTLHCTMSGTVFTAGMFPPTDTLQRFAVMQYKDYFAGGGRAPSMFFTQLEPGLVLKAATAVTISRAASQI